MKKEKEALAAKEQNKIIGQASLGGDWELTRLDGSKGGSEDLRGNFGLIYFGFTHCPGSTLCFTVNRGYGQCLAGFALFLHAEVVDRRLPSCG